ncbi:MAG: hypothetical protein K6V97_03060 [Actinomycetia bacterium]|nr:hypothetical protein [Actinomycetes bacterium]
MRLFSSKAGKILAPVAMTVLLGGSAYAFMASNTVNNSSAGTGSGTISGYTVSNISYKLDGSNNNPDGIDSVTFTLTPADGTDPATSVAVWFNGNTAAVASTANKDCSLAANENQPASPATTWTCNVSSLGATAGNGTTLDVAAAH